MPNQSGSLCAYAINAAGNGNNPLVGCRFVNTNPFGSLDGAEPLGERRARPRLGARPGHHRRRSRCTSTSTATRSRPITANNARADIGAMFRAYSASHAFDAVVPLGPGTHIVCAYAINRGSGFANPLARLRRCRLRHRTHQNH